jgi:hypothetical protein
MAPVNHQPRRTKARIRREADPCEGCRDGFGGERCARSVDRKPAAVGTEATLSCPSGRRDKNPGGKRGSQSIQR